LGGGDLSEDRSFAADFATEDQALAGMREDKVMSPALVSATITDRLDGSEYTAEDILAKLKTVDGPGSGLDADQLDGKQAAAFVQTSRSVSTGTGLTGGGDLSSNRTLSAVIPSEAEAEAGTNNTKLMTPLRTKQAINAAADALVGAVMPFAFTTPPTGWFECDGSALSRTSYQALFDKIGITFGAGNGSTTFNIPDLRGEFLRSWDNGRGVDSGRGFGS
jgi:phage-related tail fiber protein